MCSLLMVTGGAVSCVARLVLALLLTDQGKETLRDVARGEVYCALTLLCKLRLIDQGQGCRKLGGL